MDYETKEQDYNRSSIIESFNQEWAYLMEAVQEFYGRIDEFIAFCGEIEDGRKKLERVNWERVSPEKCEEVRLEMQKCVDAIENKSSALEIRFHCLCDSMEDVISVMRSLNIGSKSSKMHSQELIDEKAEKYKMFTEVVKNRVGFERNYEQKRIPAGSNNTPIGMITELGNVESIKIGFSFGAAEYYRETSSFCPFGHICVCLKSDGTLFSEEYVTFWNQSSTPDGAITYSEDESDNPYEEVFSIGLNHLPSEISELMFVVKSFRHEFSNHMVRLRFGATQKQYDLPNKNKEIFTERVLIRLRRNNGWTAEVCEEFCDIDYLLGNSTEKE